MTTRFPHHFMFTARMCPAGGAGGGNTQALEAVLVPLARLLKASSAVEGRVGEVVGRSGLPPLLVELLRHPRPAVVLPALEALNDIYKQHQRPKARPSLQC